MDETKDEEYNKLYVCMSATCVNLKHRRGLCSGHYNIYREMVKKRETSWEKLASLGRAKRRGLDIEAERKFILKELEMVNDGDKEGSL
mgnify:CR=1 FL=1